MSTSDVVDIKTVKHVAKLSNLPLTDDEAKTYQKNLSSILEYISKINELETEGVAQTNQVTGLTNVFRKDEVDMSRVLSQKDALACAKKTHQGYFVVSAVIES